MCGPLGSFHMFPDHLTTPCNAANVGILISSVWTLIFFPLCKYCSRNRYSDFSKSPQAQKSGVLLLRSESCMQNQDCASRSVLQTAAAGVFFCRVTEPWFHLCWQCAQLMVPASFSYMCQVTQLCVISRRLQMAHRPNDWSASSHIRLWDTFKIN